MVESLKEERKVTMAKKTTIKEVVNEKDSQLREEKYNQYVKQMTPKHSWLLNLLKAYLVGGIICTIGQAIMNMYLKMGDMKQDTASAYTSLTLVLISVILTGFNIYQKLAKFGGAGTVVPITGFANSVAAPAVEYQKEGQVFGIGCKIFTIAGPVILYGIFSSWFLGVIYYIFRLFTK
ncbi:stage V sporulation protein AC [Lachnospiraceae bacterium KM106-2]|nr:stage V sporulation protein AC [Lachnospiraceae bacterium KM106-2]